MQPSASAALRLVFLSESSSAFKRAGRAGSAGLPINPRATAARHRICGLELVSNPVNGATASAPMEAKDHAAISPSDKNVSGIVVLYLSGVSAEKTGQPNS